MTDDQRDIADECDALKAFLLAKNAAYGSSFASPMRVFAKGLSPEAQVRVRLDDKLARLAKGDPSFGDEDILIDITGYLILLRVLRRREAALDTKPANVLDSDFARKTIGDECYPDLEPVERHEPAPVAKESFDGSGWVAQRMTVEETQ